MTDPLDDRQCTAKSKRSQKRCKRWAIRGGTVCAMHGGKIPVVVQAAERRLEQRRAVLAAETFGLSREIDPHTALLEELHRTAGVVDWLGAVVADLDQGTVVWGKTKDTTGEDAGMTTFEARPNAWVELWHRERKHLVAVAEKCISAGIEERRVRLAEQAGAQLAGVVRAVVDALFAVLVEVLASHEAAFAAVRSAWGPAVLEIAPRELRRLSVHTSDQEAS